MCTRNCRDTEPRHGDKSRSPNEDIVQRWWHLPFPRLEARQQIKPLSSPDSAHCSTKSSSIKETGHSLIGATRSCSAELGGKTPGMRQRRKGPSLIPNKGRKSRYPQWDGAREYEHLLCSTAHLSPPPLLTSHHLYLHPTPCECTLVGVHGCTPLAMQHLQLCICPGEALPPPCLNFTSCKTP